MKHPLQNLLQGSFAAFVVADADGFVNAADEDFAVADAACAGGGDDGLHGFLLQIVGKDELDLTLGRRSTVYSRPR